MLSVFDEDGNRAFNASYDAWGRQTVSQNDIDLRYGYCGHETLFDFGLIDMGGRVYDPVIGRFLSCDNFVQEPENSQNFNRYSYCLNNPLRYSDPSGELFWLIPAAIIVGSGIVNAAMNADNIHNFGQGMAYFGVGCASAATAMYTGGAGICLSGALLGGGNSLLTQSFNGGKIDWFNVANASIFGAITSAVSAGIGEYVSSITGNWFKTVENIVLRNTLEGATGGTILGAGMSLLGVANGGKFSWSDFGESAGIGALQGALGGYAKGRMESAKAARLERLSRTLDEPASANTLTPEQIVQQKISSSEWPQGQGTNTVYLGTDPVTHEVKYVGITERDPSIRFAEHQNSGTVRAGLSYQAIDGTGALSRTQARILEQTLINYYGLGKNGGMLYNKINSISSTKWGEYLIQIKW